MISRLHRSLSRRFFKDRIRQARRRKSRTCMLESLEQRQLLAADFQNPENAYEVTLDGFVAPIDALNIINDLNANGARDLREPGVVLPDGPLDVDGDYFIAPIDALMIINLLNLDFELPAIQARLQTDTGASDGVTSDSTISGQLISLTDQRQLTVQVDDGDTVNVELDPFGNFSLDATAFPSGVLDGPRTFHLAAVDRYGMASLDISFTLDTTPAAIDSFGLHPDSDTAPVGDGRTEESLVTLVGMTEPLAEVRLVETDETIVADASGAFAFADVPLSLGDNMLTLVTTDAAENFSSPQEYGVVRYDPNGAPVVSAQLLNDTGDPEDGVSSEIGVGGTVASALDVTRFLARFEEAASDQYVEITGALGQGGSFQLGATTLADVLGAALNDGVYHLQLRAEDSGGNVSPPYVLAFERDTAAPAAQVWLDDNAAIGLTTSSATTTIAGQTDAGAQLVLTPGPVQSQADSGGGFSFTNVTLEPGVNHFTLQVSDAAGNSRSLPLQITRTSASGQIELLTSSGLASEQGWIVDLGQASGTRKLTFDVQAAISPPGQAGQLGDRLLVYLLDPQDPARTLLDGTRAGTALFALHADGAEYPQGLVSRVGSQVTIDLSSLGGLSQGLLLFQLLNLDATTQSGATIQFVANTVNPSGTSSPIFMPASPTAPAGPAMDLGATTISQELVSELKNVAYNSETGVLAVDLVVMNRGPAVGRAMAAALPTLPANVVLLNASGQLPDGTPYVNLRDGIPRGGLAQQSRTTAVRLEILNRDGVPLTLAPVVYSGGPNRAPVMEAPGSLQVMPGHEAMAKLVATDPDGDRVTFSIRPTADLPTLVLNANGELLVTPQPGEEGSYAIDVVASDGVLQAAQTLVVDVIPDTDTSSRLSGKVLDVDGTPLAGVPVSVGRLTVMTDQDGHFLIEFPSMQVPTEEFSIEVPRGDIYFDPFDTGDQLLSFRRARYDNATGTDTTNPRQHPNLVTSFLDASMVYGSDSERALALRMLDGTGRLKTSPGDLLPFNNTDYFANAPLENDSAGMVDPGSLFVAGDVRASENAVLASLHTLLVREHNRLADEIAANNPSLTDEQIHQQARRMVGAIVQNITYSEYLPLLLGADALQPYAGYQPDARSEIGSFFATVAFRIGHSQMVAQFERLDTNGDEIANGHLSLREAFFNSAPIVEDGIDVILRGAATQVAEAIDTRVIDDLRNFLFGPPGAGGMDLPAMSIQRAREMGIPSYVQARADLGLTAVARFEDITSDPDLQNRLEDTYGTIDRIDAFVGGLAEDPVPGAMVGELFQAAIARQFEITRAGDRFWFENQQFTDAELSFVRGTTLAALIERNTGIENLPANVFTTGADPGKPAEGGGPAAAPVDEARSYDGTGNNLQEPSWGSTGQHLGSDTGKYYADGISAPNGQDRPSARAVSNGVLDQGQSNPSPVGATTLGVFWGQLISHDLSLTPTGISDTLRVHGDEAQIEGKHYPFVAEKIELLLEHVFYESTNNVIHRAIYLPAVDMDNAVTIDPQQETMVMTEAIPMAGLAVAAGTLEDGDGNLFDQQVSITAVPPELTPAALPDGLQPDLVVTIQPAELLFTTPAPLSLPNTFGYAPGEMLDLWSINPASGEFEKVGQGQVSADGEVIETVQGGVRTSSWHFFGPPPPPPDDFEDPEDNDRNKDDGDQECEDCTDLSSVVMLHSGAVIEAHELVSYQSQGVTRGLQLVYDSLRADPRPILHFGYQRVQADPRRMLVARMTVFQGDQRFQVPGYELHEPADTDFHTQQFQRNYGDFYFGGQTETYTISATAGQSAVFERLKQYDTYCKYDDNGNPISCGTSERYWGYSVSIISPSGETVYENENGFDRVLEAFVFPETGDYTIEVDPHTRSFGFRLNDITDKGLLGGEHFFNIPPNGGKVDAAIAADMRTLPSGRYDYLLSTGLRRFSTGGLLGTSSSRTGEVVHVNSIDSPFGTGWGLAGWQQLIENADGSVLLVDGDGTELIFEPPAEMGAPYVSPVGDFSELRKLEDGTFARVFKDQTRHAFTSTHKLHTITDRNGNVTEFQYDTEGQLTAIVDPVGLTTSFEYTDGKITSIIDPAQRVTRLEYDQFGNLASITDPDQTSRTWEYDSLGHMVAEIDKRGFREETYYNHAGRAIGALRKDGSRIELEPVQSQGVYPSEQTTSLLDAPTAWPLGPAEVSYVDARGNVTRTLLDQAGQRVVSFDGEGRLPSVERNAENLVTKSTDGRGFVTLYEYDQRGNLVEVSDELSGGEVSGSFETAGEQHEYVFAGKAGQAIAVDSLATSLSQLQIQLEQTDGTLLYSSLPFSHPLELPSDGDYRLVVRRTDANLSEYGFRVVDLAQQPEIRLGEQVVGSLNPGQESDFYRFQGQTGDRVLWQHVSSTTSSGSLVLYAPDGQILSSDSSLQSDLFAELIMDGEYVVVVNGNSGTSVDYAYDLRTTQSQIRALPLNQAATFTVAGVGQELLLAFYAQKDQLVSLQSDSLYSFDVQVRFADGSQRANIYAEQVFSAPTTGIHVFSLMPQYSWLSDVTVELVASSTEVLVPGDTLHGDLGANYSAAIFPLAVNSGDLVSFSTPQSGGMSLTVLEKDADGDVYSTYSSYSGNVVFQAEAGSQYWVEMTGVGPFSVPSALVQPETLPIILDQDVRAALPSGGEWKVFTFDANAGQTVFLEDRTHPTENWYYGQRLPWRLTSPTGADLTDQMVGGDPEDGFWFAQPATLTETGQYSLEYKLTASAEHAQVDFALHTLSGLPTVALEEATNVTFESAAPDGDTLYPHAFFQVDLDAFDLVQLELLGDAGGTPITWQLFGPDQLPLVQNWLQPSESVISLESGSHLLVLSTPLSDSLATVSFRLHAPAVNVQSANLNELITLQFDEPDKSFLLEIGGTDGQRVVFLPVVEDYWNYRYTLISPSGSVDLNPSYYAVRPFTLTETGTYRLAVSRVNPSGATSQLQFELRDVAQAIELQDGGSYAFTLALGDSAELYRFQGATGRELLIAGGVTTTDSGYLELTIYGSNDDVTHAQYVYGSDDIQLGGSFNDAGDYLLVVRAGVPSETYHVAFDVDEVLLMSEPLPLNQVVKPPSPYPGMLRTYTFDGNAGSRFLFDDRNQLRYGNTMARLFAPDGSDVTSLMLEEVVESSYWSYFVPHPFQLPQDGEYTLEVSVEYLPNEGFAFGMYDLAELSPLALGQVPPDDENIHRVSGQAGQTLLLDNLPTAQNDYYYYYGHLSEWSLLTADGTVVAESREDTDGWLVLPETGDYFLRHWSEYNNGERAVAFRLLDVADAPPLTIGSETTAEFTRGGQTEIFKLESDDTDVLQFGGADAADAAVSMTLITADGQVQAGTASSLAPFLATISPPGTEYLLVAAPYSLGSTRVPFEVSQAAVDGNVSLDTLQTVSLDAQHPRRRLTLNGTAGQWLQFTNSSATDTTSGNWALSDHTGAVLAGHLPLGDSFMVALPSDGEYFLDVWQASDAADNDVQFLITDLRGTTLATVGALASLTLDMDSPSAYYRLQGAADQRLWLDAVSDSDWALSWSLFDSRLQPVALERTLDGVSDVRLPATGEYLVALALDPSVDSAIFSWAAYDFADAGVLTLGVDAQGSLAPDESPQLYQVTLPDVGSYSFQSLHTPGAYGGWTLLDEDLNALWQQDLDQSYGQVIVATGPYYLLLENFDVVVKDFTIQVSRTDDDEGAAVVGQVVSGDIAAPGQRDVLSLDVLAGQQLLFAPIDLYVDSGWYNTRFDITVLDAAGREIRGLVPPESDPPRVYTVPEDSTYSIQFYSLDGETGGYAFQVLDLATAALITLDQVETVSLTEQGQRAAVKFDAVQGQRLWFDSRDNDEQYDWYDTWNYSWWLYGPGNSDGSSFYLGTDALLNIPMTGTYYVVFRSELTEAVDVDFMVMNGSNAAPLGVGDTLSDSLTNDFETKLYRLPINAGQTLWLDHRSVTGLDGFETVPWKLLSATGTAVVSSSLGTDAAVHRNAADELLLVVSGEAYANTVNYDLHVLDAATATALTLDADISGALETGRTTHLYRLDGGAGQRLWFENLVDGLSGFQWRLMRTVSGSGGTLLSTMFNASMAADQTVELPVDGTYFLAIEGRGSDDPLDYSFRLNTPVETSQTLAPGTRVMGNIVNPGDQVVYSFHAEPGQFFVIDDLDTNGYYFPFTLQLPDGSEEDLNYSSAEPFLVTQSGTHQLTVSGRNLQTGEFALELVDLQVAPQLTLGEELAGRLNPSGESDVFQFTGARNQRLVLDYVSVDGGANWSLFTSSGAAVTQDRFLNTDVLVTLPEDGTYYLLVYGRNPGGSPVNYQFVMRETLTVSEQLNVGPGGGGPERFAYDTTFNQLVFHQDSLGRITTFALDETNGNVLESRRVIGQPDSESDESDDQVFNFTYSVTGQIDTITDPLGRITDYEYDAQGRLQSVTLAMGTVDEEVMQYEYDAAGNPAAFIDANLNRTEFTFDDLNRLVRITEADPDGGGPLTSPVTEFAYDANGNIEVVTDAGGSTTTNAYDSLNRLIMSTDEQGNQTQYTYDSAGNLISIVDPLGDTSTNEYDSRNRITSNVDPNGAVTRFLYDFDNNLVGIVDSVGNETQFDYDARSRLITETDPLGSRIQYTYDANDNVLQKVDRLGRVTRFQYDELDRVISEVWINADQATVANTITYVYDDIGRLVSVADAYSSLAFTHDDRDRLKTVDNAGTPDAPHVLLTYTYDTAGNVLSVADTIEGFGGAITSYDYDALNRVIQTLQSGNNTSDKRVDFAYNPLGQFVAIDRFSDLQGTQLVVGTTYSYDNLNRLEDLRHNNGTVDVAFYEFTYDTASRMATINDVDGLTTFSYDDRGQLTGADRDVADARGDETYQYDANGNRVSSHTHGTSYQTGDNNRLLSDGTYDYEYDDEGNLIRRTEVATGKIRELEFDHRNRLVAVTDREADGTPTQRVEFRYDALNRRILQHVDETPSDGIDGIFEQYVYEGDNVMLDFVDGDGRGTAESPVVTKRYLHGAAVDQVLAQDDGAGGVQWHLSDHLGTIRDLVDNTGVVVNHIVYDSFGNVVSETNELVESRYLFTGRELDEEVQLYYYRARYYDAAYGAFLSEDPIRFAAGDPNLYRYVENQPLWMRDAFGLEGSSQNGVGSGTAGAGGTTGALGGSGSQGAAQGLLNEVGSQLGGEGRLGSAAAGGATGALNSAFSGGSAQDAAFAGAAGAAGGALFPGPGDPDYSVDPYFQYDPNGFSNSTYGLGISCNEKGLDKLGKKLDKFGRRLKGWGNKVKRWFD